jgi:hypothetical protein
LNNANEGEAQTLQSLLEAVEHRNAAEEELERARNEVDDHRKRHDGELERLHNAVGVYISREFSILHITSKRVYKPTKRSVSFAMEEISPLAYIFHS